MLTIPAPATFRYLTIPTYYIFRLTSYIFRQTSSVPLHLYLILLFLLLLSFLKLFFDFNTYLTFHGHSWSFVFVLQKSARTQNFRSLFPLTHDRTNTFKILEAYPLR